MLVSDNRVAEHMKDRPTYAVSWEHFLRHLDGSGSKLGRTCPIPCTAPAYYLPWSPSLFPSSKGSSPSVGLLGSVAALELVQNQHALRWHGALDLVGLSSANTAPLCPILSPATSSSHPSPPSNASPCLPSHPTHISSLCHLAVLTAECGPCNGYGPVRICAGLALILGLQSSSWICLAAHLWQCTPPISCDCTNLVCACAGLSTEQASQGQTTHFMKFMVKEHDIYFNIFLNQTQLWWGGYPVLGLWHEGQRRIPLCPVVENYSLWSCCLL